MGSPPSQTTTQHLYIYQAQMKLPAALLFALLTLLPRSTQAYCGIVYEDEYFRGVKIYIYAFQGRPQPFRNKSFQVSSIRLSHGCKMAAWGNGGRQELFIIGSAGSAGSVYTMGIYDNRVSHVKCECGR